MRKGSTYSKLQHHHHLLTLDIHQASGRHDPSLAHDLCLVTKLSMENFHLPKNKIQNCNFSFTIKVFEYQKKIIYDFNS